MKKIFIGIVAVILLALVASFFGSGTTTQEVRTDLDSANTISEPTRTISLPSEIKVIDNTSKPSESVPPEKKVIEPVKNIDTNNNCHPNYSGCLNPNASDYDCAGGSGNGPYYTGKVQVLGPDVFDLDRDNDGWACE